MFGWFYAALVEKIGFPIPEFDFSVPGVTSMSADNHKYGFGFKGSSSVIFRDNRFEKYQYFAYTNWSGGIYVSATMNGTRPGGVIAGTWAAMKALGEKGYLEIAQKTMDTAQALMKGVESIPELFIYGKPDMTVFSFGSKKINLYVLADVMQKKGWVLDRLQKPTSLHCIVNPHQAQVVDEFINDLKESIEYVKKNPQKDPEGTAGMYGLVSKIQFSKLTRKMVKNKVIDFLADVYRTD